MKILTALLFCSLLSAADLPAVAALTCDNLPKRVLATARLSWLDEVGNFITGSTQEYWSCMDSGSETRPTVQPKAIGGVPVGGWSVTILYSDTGNSCTTMSIFTPGAPQEFAFRCEYVPPNGSGKKRQGATFSFAAVAP